MIENINIKQIENINIDEILSLYVDAGWTNYTNNLDMLANAYKNSLIILGAYDGNRLIGVIRAVGDGYSIVYIQDIIVLNSYQRKGIGTKLLNSILEKYNNVYQKVLLTDDQSKTINFYKSFGFFKATDLNCVAFIMGLYQ